MLVCNTVNGVGDGWARRNSTLMRAFRSLGWAHWASWCPRARSARAELVRVAVECSGQWVTYVEVEEGEVK